MSIEELRRSVGRERGPNANHKYKDRKRVDGRWVYDYGKGYPGENSAPATQGTAADPTGTQPLGTVRSPRSGYSSEPMSRPPPRPKVSARPSNFSAPHPAAKYLLVLGKNRTRIRIDTLLNHAETRGMEGDDWQKAKDAVQDLRAKIATGTSLAELVPSPKDLVAPPAKTLAIHPPGDRAALMKQVGSINKWTRKSLNSGLADFTARTGFVIAATAKDTAPSANRVKATQTAAITLLAIRHLINVTPDLAKGVRTQIIATGSKRTHATYEPNEIIQRTFRVDRARVETVSQKSKEAFITVHDGFGHSMMHEFGHYLDHSLGDLEVPNAFASARGGTPSNPKAAAQKKAMNSFVDAALATDSATTWQTTERTVERGPNTLTISRPDPRFIHYLNERHEVVARFFDCWAHWKLKQKGFDTEALMTAPQYKRGGFDDKDIEKLAPLFEAALGETLAKSVFAALQDLAWLAKSRLEDGFCGPLLP